MHNFNQKEIDVIAQIALEAGEIAKKFWLEKNFEIYQKNDRSKVTTADLQVSKFIAKQLEKNFPNLPIICEEGSQRNAENSFWLVDPIDGTSSFIKGEDQFAVNIALIKQEKAVFGLIYAPVFEGGKICYSGIFDEKNGQEFLGNCYKKSVAELNQNTKEKHLKIITSARTKDADITNYIRDFYPEFFENYQVEKLSSAIKFLRIMENKSDLYLHFRPSMEWDTAAGQALIELAGGKVKKLDFNQEKFFPSQDLKYCKENFLNQAFAAKIKNF